ncbi:hypothetical protein EDC01DRAFT_762812 [Geopyxis carbonaria]|nr:hypothetical protein EDC01DRAFT_762812 [Geopyxis carbonaria]
MSEELIGSLMEVARKRSDNTKALMEKEEEYLRTGWLFLGVQASQGWSNEVMDFPGLLASVYWKVDTQAVGKTKNICHNGFRVNALAVTEPQQIRPAVVWIKEMISRVTCYQTEFLRTTGDGTTHSQFRISVSIKCELKKFPPEFERGRKVQLDVDDPDGKWDPEDAEAEERYVQKDRHLVQILTVAIDRYAVASFHVLHMLENPSDITLSILFRELVFKEHLIKIWFDMPKQIAALDATIEHMFRGTGVSKKRGEFCEGEVDRNLSRVPMYKNIGPPDYFRFDRPDDLHFTTGSRPCPLGLHTDGVDYLWRACPCDSANIDITALLDHILRQHAFIPMAGQMLSTQTGQLLETPAVVSNWSRSLDQCPFDQFEKWMLAGDRFIPLLSTFKNRYIQRPKPMPREVLERLPAWQQEEARRHYEKSEAEYQQAKIDLHWAYEKSSLGFETNDLALEAVYGDVLSLAMILRQVMTCEDDNLLATRLIMYGARQVESSEPWQFEGMLYRPEPFEVHKAVELYFPQVGNYDDFENLLELPLVHDAVIPRPDLFPVSIDDLAVVASGTMEPIGSSMNSEILAAVQQCTWLGPLKHNKYEELRTNAILMTVGARNLATRFFVRFLRNRYDIYTKNTTNFLFFVFFFGEFLDKIDSNSPEDMSPMGNKNPPGEIMNWKKLLAREKAENDSNGLGVENQIAFLLGEEGLAEDGFNPGLYNTFHDNLAENMYARPHALQLETIDSVFQELVLHYLVIEVSDLESHENRRTLGRDIYELAHDYRKLTSLSLWDHSAVVELAEMYDLDLTKDGFYYKHPYWFKRLQMIMGMSWVQGRAMFNQVEAEELRYNLEQLGYNRVQDMISLLVKEMERFVQLDYVQVEFELLFEKIVDETVRAGRLRKLPFGKLWFDFLVVIPVVAMPFLMVVGLLYAAYSNAFMVFKLIFYAVWFALFPGGTLGVAVVFYGVHKYMTANKIRLGDSWRRWSRVLPNFDYDRLLVNSNPTWSYRLLVRELKLIGLDPPPLRRLPMQYSELARDLYNPIRPIAPVLAGLRPNEQKKASQTAQLQKECLAALNWAPPKWAQFLGGSYGERTAFAATDEYQPRDGESWRRRVLNAVTYLLLENPSYRTSHVLHFPKKMQSQAARLADEQVTHFTLPYIRGTLLPYPTVPADRHDDTLYHWFWANQALPSVFADSWTPQLTLERTQARRVARAELRRWRALHPEPPEPEPTKPEYVPGRLRPTTFLDPDYVAPAAPPVEPSGIFGAPRTDKYGRPVYPVDRGTDPPPKPGSRVPTDPTTGIPLPGSISTDPFTGGITPAYVSGDPTKGFPSAGYPRPTSPVDPALAMALPDSVSPTTSESSHALSLSYEQENAYSRDRLSRNLAKLLMLELRTEQTIRGAKPRSLREVLGKAARAVGKPSLSSLDELLDDDDDNKSEYEYEPPRPPPRPEPEPQLPPKSKETARLAAQAAAAERNAARERRAAAVARLRARRARRAQEPTRLEFPTATAPIRDPTPPPPRVDTSAVDASGLDALLREADEKQRSHATPLQRLYSAESDPTPRGLSLWTHPDRTFRLLRYLDCTGQRDTLHPTHIKDLYEFETLIGPRQLRKNDAEMEQSGSWRMMVMPPVEAQMWAESVGLAKREEVDLGWKDRVIEEVEEVD